MIRGCRWLLLTSFCPAAFHPWHHKALKMGCSLGIIAAHGSVSLHLKQPCWRCKMKKFSTFSGKLEGKPQGVHYSNWRLPCKKTTFIRFQKVLQVLGKRHIQTCLLKIGHGINWLINGSSMGMVRGLSSFAHLAYPYKTCHQPKVRRPCWNLVLDVTTDQQFPKNLVISSTAAIQQFLNHSNLYPTGTGANWRRSLGCYEQLMFQ